jgi:hypothetical protein
LISLLVPKVSGHHASYLPSIQEHNPDHKLIESTQDWGDQEKKMMNPRRTLGFHLGRGGGRDEGEVMDWDYRGV